MKTKDKERMLKDVAAVADIEIKPGDSSVRSAVLVAKRLLSDYKPRRSRGQRVWSMIRELHRGVVFNVSEEQSARSQNVRIVE